MRTMLTVWHFLAADPGAANVYGRGKDRNHVMMKSSPSIDDSHEGRELYGLNTIAKK